METPTDQPIPGTEEETSPSPTPDAKELQGKIGKIIEVVRNVAGSSTKAKFIVALFGVAIPIFLLAFIVSLTRRPPKPEEFKPAPIPTPRPVTPTPEPQETKEEIDELLIDIDTFDPNLKDLQPPVVDREIGL